MPPVTSGLLLWLDADDPSTLTLFGSNVVAWADKVSARTFQWPIDNPFPTLDASVLFPRPSVYFGNGSGVCWLTTPDPLTTDLPVTVFVMQYWPSFAGSYAGLAMQNGAASNALTAGAGAPSFRMSSSPGFTAWAMYANTTNVNRIYTAAGRPQDAAYLTAYVAPASMASSTIRVNQAEVSVVREVSSETTVFTLDTIGSSDGVYLANGAFAEILIYEGILSSGDIAAVETYLAEKWSSAGGIDVSVDVEGLSAAASLGAASVTTTRSVDVAVVGVAAAAQVGTVVEQTVQSVDVQVTDVLAQTSVGEVFVSTDFAVAVSGVSGSVLAGYGLVWSAVDDVAPLNWQNLPAPPTANWSPVNDTQAPGWTPIS